ncbi:ABC transporter ATP-binding protein [Occallatibacter riparius]|uniref:ATP-binding cassette domain-containing protein n=1 Tax=Occallatibacter riparius TaxID=1002689 RepID=A0A9J7BJ04_9BACT|nr:ATP-binding cassette domain-containing protein [Occallatibacter riparius]UWZ82663.1 ATP-binding cassette domain-containing protein [Occallatibacter riparius]
MSDLVNSGNGLKARAAEVAEPVIVFENVFISFSGRPVLEDVSYHVGKGQTLCILGRSGVGKSVSLRVLMGFLKPDAGSVRVEGQEITDLSETEMNALRRRITMVFQNGALFDSLTVRENVAFPLREQGGLEEDQIMQVVDRLLDLVGASDVEGLLPASLSTGRRRAVAIARALAAQPEIVLYDEPTTMVDPLIARRLGSIIQRLKSQLGYTSIVVTHDMRFAERLADLVLFLHQGKAHFFGPLKAFMESQDEAIQQFLTLDAYELPMD